MKSVLKDIKAMLIMSLFIMASMSCSNEFLNLNPISNASIADFYKSPDDFQLAVNGIYARLRSGGTFHDFVPLLADLHSDNTTVGTTAGTRTDLYEMSEFRDQPVNSVFSTIWNDHYAAIAACNMITDRINDIYFSSEDTKNQLVAETRFLRALFYFNLVRIFGDVPLVSTEIKSIEASYEIGRSPINEVYQLIEADLLFAAAHLPASYPASDVGRPTSGAAKGILGKAYLTQKKFAEASQVLKEVIVSNQYELLSDFNDLWKVENKNHKESIFDIQFKKQASVNTGSNYSARFTPYLSGVALIGFETTNGGCNTPTEDLLNTFSNDDLRKKASVAEGYTDQNGNYVSGLSGRHTRKFLGPYTNGQRAEDNWPVLRYADVLLMYAEALNEQSFQPGGEAFTYLNQVRRRAGLLAAVGNSSEEGVLVASQEEFRKFVATERRLELAFEGHRWFDLVRTGRALEVLNSKGYNIKDYQLLLPIPQVQLDINPGKLIQNPGY